MLKTTVCCDICGDKLPTKTVHTIWGDVEEIKTERTRVWDTHNVFPCLCVVCALKIDNALMKLKQDLLIGGANGERKGGDE